MLITGEKFQSLSQISFCSARNIIIDSQLNHMQQNLHVIDTFPVDQIHNYKIIFCYTHDINHFLGKFFDHLSDDTILITHNSDHGIDSSYIKFLDSSKIKTWYCQNRYTTHPKLVSLPIGIANSQWQHGSENTLLSIRDEGNDKTRLVYKNFNIDTNTGLRIQCDRETSNNGIVMSPATTNEEYWREISKSHYTISPPGNGIDCHRIWECIALRSIPIVIKHEAFSQFLDLPILFVNSYSEITEELLQRELLTFKMTVYSADIINIDYWRDRVK